MPTETTANVDLIVSSRSRRGQAEFQKCLSLFKDLGVAIQRAQRVSRERDLQWALEASIAAGAPVVAVGGGDGTMRIAAEVLAGRGPTLGVLPLGTGNSFSRLLGIGHDVERACQVIAHGRREWLDVGRANGRTFLTYATIGVSTQIALSLDPAAKRRLGLISYLRPTIEAFRRSRPFQVQVVSENGARTIDALQVVVANGLRRIGPTAEPKGTGLTSGRLQVYVLASRDKSHLVRFFAALALNSLDASEIMDTFEASQFSLDTLPAKRVAIDGDVVLRTPVRFQASSERLLTLVPEEFEAETR
jgi:YegS/Rv2252/BmrU family lipid kinase